MFHEKPDPNVCPHCGAQDSIRELDKPVRFQPVRMGYDDDGVLVPESYDEWQVSDDGEAAGYECSECYTDWPSNYALAYAQRLYKALADHRDHAETRTERLRELAQNDRLDTVDGAEKIAYADGRAEAFAHALAILQGNGEA